MRYEDAIGPIDPGCVFTTPDLQKIDREMHTQMTRDTVWLTLSVCHPSMDPDEISDALNLDPDDVKCKGDVVFKNEKYDIRSNKTMWSFDTMGYVRNNTFEKHLNWLLDHLHGKTPAIHKLQDDGCDMHLKAHLDLSSSCIFPALEVDEMRLLAQLRIPIRFIVRYLPAIEEEEEEAY